jgi:hypothetical protein
MLIRRMVGKNAHKSASDIDSRLDEIRNGVYQSELDHIKKMGRIDLLKLYKEFQATKRDVVAK